MSGKVVLLVGSAKHEGSSSAVLGAYLLERLAEQGMTTRTFRVHMALRTPANRSELVDAVNDCDLFVVAYPLYVDTLPALVIEAFEMLAEARRGGYATMPRMAAVANCGFPEAQHNDNSLKVCQRFASEAGFAWAGGLAMGMGGAVGGERLESKGGMLRYVQAGLDEAAAALAAGQAIPASAAVKVARPVLHRWLYIQMASFGWRKWASENRVRGELRRKPYVEGR